jgi:serine/threonine protein kinase
VTYLEQNSDSGLEPELQEHLLLGVAQGMAYLHRDTAAMAHGDLKPENILVTQEYNGSARTWKDTLAKITDFGSLKRIRTDVFGSARGLESRGQRDTHDDLREALLQDQHSDRG